jgi:hypothetical protein
MLGPTIGGIVAILACIGAARVIKVGGLAIRRLLARMGRALARLDVDAWCADVARGSAPASDATVVSPAPRMKVRK